MAESDSLRGCRGGSTQLDDGWRVLLLRVYNYWDFPKGIVEPGEDPLTTARREVREETDIEDLEFRWGEEFIETEPYSRNKVARYYLATSPAVDSQTTRERRARAPEHHEYRWLDLDAARKLVVPRIAAVLAGSVGASARRRFAQTTRPRLPPRRKSSMLSASSSTARCRASNAAHAMCGVTMRFGMSGANSGLPFTGGSCGSTSMAAPPRSPPRNAVDQRLEIDQCAARGVDQQRVGFHQRQLALADQPGGRRCQRAVQRQHVGGAQQLVERHAHRANDVCVSRVAPVSRPGAAPPARASPARPARPWPPTLPRVP